MGLALGGAVGCQRSEPAQFSTRAELPERDRRPAGIAVDLRSSPPPSVDHAQTDQPVIALRAPLGLSAAMDVVDAFFEAVYAEDMTALADLIQPKTRVDDMRAAPNAKSHVATTLWRQRFQKRDYQALDGHLVYRRGDIATYRGEGSADLPLSVRYLEPDDDIGRDDLVLQVPVLTHSIRSERLLGDEIFFWLRRQGSRYVIVRMAEEVPF